MRTSKTFLTLLSLLCGWIVFVVIAAPAVLVYEWLHPTDFWQRLAFAASLLVVFLIPFGRKANKTSEKPDAPRNREHLRQTLDRIYTPVRPASLLHRELAREMRDAAISYGLVSKRQIN